MPYSEFIIFTVYKNNGYYFIYHKQGNIILYSIHAIFDKKIFSKYTNSYTKEYKLYNRLLNKISSETGLSLSDSFRKDGPTPLPTLHTPFSSIQNNSPTHSSSSSLSYKSIFPSPTLGFKKSIIEIKEDNGINSDIEMQPCSPQQPLQPALQTL